jgi:hypothetical protein
LVAELLDAEDRGLGTTIVTSVGLAGTIGAAVTAMILDWRSAFLFGGVMGYALLGLRIFVHESPLFSALKLHAQVPSGRLRDLFAAPAVTMRLFLCVLAGTPIYCAWGLFVSFSPEIAQSMGIMEPVTVAEVMLVAAIPATLGDLAAGLLSQLTKSRKRPMVVSVICGALSLGLLALRWPTTPFAYACVIGAASFFCGYWACLITTTAEQFGTNIRAMATTLVPNLVRSSAILMTSSFVQLKAGGWASVDAALLVAVGTYTFALLAVLNLRESYGRDLGFLESGGIEMLQANMVADSEAKV